MGAQIWPHHTNVCKIRRLCMSILFVSCSQITFKLHIFSIERIHSRGHHPCKFMGTREIFYIWRAQLPQDLFGTPTIGHFTVMVGSEGEGDLVLIQTFFALLWKLFLKNTSKHKNNLIYIIKQEGLYQNKVTLSLASIHNCKMAYITRRREVMWIRSAALTDFR